MYYSNKDCPGAWLDVDDTTGYGPETITIESYSWYMSYLVYVFDYAPDSNHPMYTSEGQIDIKPPGGDNSMTVNIPNGNNTDRFWIIGMFNGTEGLSNIEIMNTIVSDLDLEAACRSFGHELNSPSLWDTLMSAMLPWRSVKTDKHVNFGNHNTIDVFGNL